MKNVKIIIGANYGDEGKGLTARHFATKSDNSIIVLDNGTAQRGHTVDYIDGSRHVFHHFGSAALDGVPTYYNSNFLIHPMEFRREWTELKGRVPRGFYAPDCFVITPFDMLIDHMTEDYIAVINGNREHGSCGFGSWCATDRIKKFGGIPILDLKESEEKYRFYMDIIWKECLAVLDDRKINIDKIPQYMPYFTEASERRKNVIENFKQDLRFFCMFNNPTAFDFIWKQKDCFVFEMGQGLGLDQNVDNEWHTTSNTGVINPYLALKDKDNFSAEVCYVSRTYLTRHGMGPLEENVKKKEINENMEDKTNVFNNFQGNLRYGFIEDMEQKKRIAKDWSIVENDKRFTKAKVLTHYNEFVPSDNDSKYYSDNKFEIKER